MRDGGGGGGDAGMTNWYAYNTEQMWRLLAHQDTDNQWKQVSGWRKISELTSLHAARIREYRENLVAAWPPEKSEAARVYVSRLDYLITHVEKMSDTASANYTVFSTATADIATTRHKLKRLHDEYVKKKRQKALYDAAQASPRPSPSPSPSPTPRVTEADLATIDAQARALMYSLSSTLAASTQELASPPTWKPPGRARGSGSDTNSGNGSGPPPTSHIPPLVPVPVLPQTPQAPPLPPTPPTTPPVVQPTAPAPGPILGGAGPQVPTAPMPPAPPGVITPAPPAGPGLPGLLAPHMPGGAFPQPPSGTGYIGGGTRPPGAGGTPAMPRPAMPPGGLIGGMPGSHLGQPAAGAAGAARRINPIGGVIGGGTGSAVPGSGQRSAAGSGRMTGGLGVTPHGSGMAARGPVSGRSRDERESGREWDPDNPWETEEGVAPVVMPDRPDNRIDPGPAIGFNR